MLNKKALYTTSNLMVDENKQYVFMILLSVSCLLNFSNS